MLAFNPLSVGVITSKVVADGWIDGTVVVQFTIESVRQYAALRRNGCSLAAFINIALRNVYIAHAYARVNGPLQPSHVKERNTFSLLHRSLPYTAVTISVKQEAFEKKILGPFATASRRTPPVLHCHSPGVATVARHCRLCLITLSNINRFSHFFHYQNHEKNLQ